MSIDAFLGGVVKFGWVPDHVRTIAHLSPRHLTRPVSFEYFLTEDPDDYTSERVLGSFEGVHGDWVQVSGVEYHWNQISNMKVWRSEVRK